MKRIVLSLIALTAFGFGAFAQWTQIGNAINGEATYDQSGTSVSINSDGTIMAIGAILNTASAGQVRVYENIAGTWTQLGSDIDGTAGGDYSGASVSISDDGLTVAIGAPNNTSNTGQVRVFSYAGGAWTQQGGAIVGAAIYDEFGGSISLTGDGLTLAIGAKLNDGPSGANVGQVQVYTFYNGAWVQQGYDIYGDGNHDQLGSSVSLSNDGSTLAVGVLTEDANGNDAGQLRVYEYATGIWLQKGSSINGEAAGHNFGATVSISADGLTVAAGAPRNTGFAGQVQVYKYINNAWTQLGSTIVGEAANDYSGSAISLSDDGLTLAVGAKENDAGASNTGQVRVYQFTTGTWVQQGGDIDGTGVADFLGTSVALSGDGLRVAAGAVGVDVNGNSSGQVTVYEFSNITTGLQTVENSKAISVYPNPTTSTLSIRSEDAIETIVVADVMGKTVKTITTPNSTIDVSELTAGVYFLQVETGKSLVIKMFVKE